MVGNQTYSEADKLNFAGVKLQNDGKYLDARRSFSASYLADPNHAYAAGNIVNVFLCEGQIDLAEELAKNEFENNKDKPWFLDRYGRALLRQDKFMEARGVYERLKGIDKEYCSGPIFDFAYGRCLYETLECARNAEPLIRASNEAEETWQKYTWLIACFHKDGLFSANEEYMRAKLLEPRQDTDFLVSRRRYLLTIFYRGWADSVKGGEDEKLYLRTAQKFALDAIEFYSIENDDVNLAEDDFFIELKELCDQVKGRLFRAESGFDRPQFWDGEDYEPPGTSFEPPEPWTP